MSGSGRPILPLAALDLAARLLEQEGFVVTARNERGDSLYLRPVSCSWHLRVSNHARTANQRSRRADILTSLVIDGPRSREQVERMVSDAVRNFRASLARKADQASGVGSRK
ncbi:MAG: hypothetical protein INR70_26265 [Parafilimonas terrae]|nr:hypothetical protein [Parafilimonas terrae]